MAEEDYQRGMGVRRQVMGDEFVGPCNGCRH